MNTTNFQLNQISVGVDGNVYANDPVETARRAERGATRTNNGREV